MTQIFLKTKTVPVGDISVSIRQLSGLERLDFMDYCSSIDEPERPVNPGEQASEEEQDRYLSELNRYTQKWFRISFITQTRLVAYGYREGVEDINERQNQIIGMMTPEQVTILHNEIAKFSGLPVPSVESDASISESTSPETTTTEEATTQEPTDPKV
ncbi:hypothetical protein ACXP2N_08155 [Vibrio alginolyticus]